jgi:hypothetical protein
MLTYALGSSQVVDKSSSKNIEIKRFAAGTSQMFQHSCFKKTQSMNIDRKLEKFFTWAISNDGM